ncbi:MAG: signal transduction histidine kinase/CheY-like chemotaxis protein [Limisphaerales bacterium]|jgi:signal transduction histidine kinase/CheY-like chemotaxis protein
MSAERIKILEDTIERLEGQLARERETRTTAESLAEHELTVLFERHRETELLRAVTAAANEAKSPEFAVRTVLQRWSQFTGWPVAHLFVVVDGPSPRLVSSGFIHADIPERYTPFLEASRTLEFVPGSQLPGRVMLSGKACSIQDVTELEGYSRSDVAAAVGLHGAFLFPVLVAQKVVAVVECYSPDAIQAEDSFCELAGQVGIQFGRVLERQRGELALMKSRDEMENQVKDRTEELQVANEDLASTARLKDQFLASMSHELRTPLNAVLGFADILLDGLQGELNEKQSRSITYIKDSGQHLLELINDILDLSKIEAGEEQLTIEEMRVCDVCEQSLKLVRSQAVKKNIGLVVECQEELPFLMADQRRVRQILANLLSNAVKFTPEAGQVGLRVTQELDHIRFSVTDSGIGISAEDQKKLFKPFIQLDSRLSRQYNGTGLGLSLVSRLTELHGGKVELESAVGSGCCFSVILPLISATLDQTETQLEPHLLERSAFERSHVSTTAPLVLLTEDNAATRESIETYLIASGYQLVHAASGKEAIEKAEELHPAVILMDIQMAEMDGFEAMRILRQRPATAKIPIVALTALAMSGDRERCLEAGANDYLSKPVSLKKLTAVIDAHLHCSTS